jgi:NAD(P)-dependent dehydrogenase (short-subunit alcohol dehydrogenase family)
MFVGQVKDFDDDEWDFIMDVNLKGPLSPRRASYHPLLIMHSGLMHCMRAQLKVLSDNGSIVNAASIAGLEGFRNNAAYAASKHGVIGLSRSAAKEAGDNGIRVNCIAPWVLPIFS